MGRWVNRDPIEEIGGYALFTSLRNAPIHWIDSIGWQSSQPTPPTTQPMYPPIDWNVNPRTYNCAGLAFGNYRPLNRDDVKGILGRFRKLTTCDMQCGECEVKCWFWEYLLDVVDLNGVQDTFYRPHLDFHIVCGQASCGGGADPERVYGKNGRGPITGPSLGVEHRPRGDGDYVDDKGPPLLPELLRFKGRRNMTETCYCSPISGLPK